MKILLSQLSLYWHSVRYLRLVQIIGRVKYLFKRSKIEITPAGNIRNPKYQWIRPPCRTQSMLGYDLFSFLNETHQISSRSDWNKESCSKLWLYNLHYFDDLNAVNSNKRSDWHRGLIDRWINDNSPGEGNGWEPYPTSLRIVNWIKWSFSNNEMSIKCLDSLATQARFLSQNLETHLMGNHLFANAKALLFAGIFFDNEEAKTWQNIAYKIINQELSEQVLSDGGNFELSTMYHTIFLEDVLDIINIHKLYDLPVPDIYNEIAILMSRWLLIMSHPDGKLSFFNDSAFAITPSVSEVRDYALHLVDENNIIIEEALIDKESYIDLSDSGYSRIQMNNMIAIIDRASIGPDYLPGHAHADTLSFELSLFNRRVVVNSGTSVYDDCPDRHQQRSTAAHSTVVIDQCNSSEVWSAFRVAKRARVYNRLTTKLNDIIKITAKHDGYKRLPGSPVHSREWLFDKNCLVITDEITGKGFHRVDSILPLHPDVSLHLLKDNRASLKVGGRNILIDISGDGILEDVNSNYHPEFGLSINNLKLIYTCSKELPIKIITRINW